MSCSASLRLSQIGGLVLFQILQHPEGMKKIIPSQLMGSEQGLSESHSG